MRSALPFVTAAVLLLTSAPFATPALADMVSMPPAEARTGAPPVVKAQTPRFKKRDRASAPQVDCTCRYRDRDIFVGEAVCMNGKLARCEMVLNNTSWSFTTEACPIASIRDDGGLGWASLRN